MKDLPQTQAPSLLQPNARADVEAIFELSSEPGLADFARGFVLPLRAYRLIRKVPELRKKTLRMSLIALLSMIALLIGLAFGAPALIEALWPSPATWYATAVQVVLKLVSFAVLFVIGANTLPPLLLVPFTDPLSLETERALGLAQEGQGSLTRALRETWRGLANMATRVAVFLFGHALLFLLNLAPGIGSVAWPIASWIWTAFWIALANLDIPMARHLYTFEHAFGLFRRRKRLLFGFGAAIALLLWIPILNAAFVPVTIVSATLLLRGLIAAGELPSPDTLARKEQAQHTSLTE